MHLLFLDLNSIRTSRNLESFLAVLGTFFFSDLLLLTVYNPCIKTLRQVFDFISKYFQFLEHSSRNCSLFILLELLYNSFIFWWENNIKYKYFVSLLYRYKVLLYISPLIRNLSGYLFFLIFFKNPMGVVVNLIIISSGIYL